ncbi:EAL domain-containing protein [Achromobacter sp. Marseille-Q0513]|uniref:putative bifunctional diguanylate cyclase/phosphodiesterase n=1 Tax=Achromobacter sp. Marseille-Q0513 TaxID=2829161 RepID=UPI0020121F0F|nr:EAL domain-containing protein [Achromobacter sp. Marseille-Q0513]
MKPESNAPVPFRPEAGLPATDPAASQAMLDSLSDPFIWLDPEWRVRYLNPAAARLLRRSLGELAGHNVWDSYPDLAGSGYHDACRAVAATGQPAAHTGYYAPLASWFEARAFPARDGIVLVLRDVSHVHAKISQLRYQATHDFLTGLPNRRQFMDTLSGAIAEAAAGLGRQRTLLAVLFLDLDRFKEVNDTFGHAEGDALLRDVAERLRRFQTPSIFCARAGGDEFALVLRDTSERAAEALANSLLNLLSMPHQIHGRSVSLGASIGIATMNSPADSADVLLDYADAAMYAAKAAGRSQVRVYRHELSPGLQERNALRGDIQAALDGNQFELHFQPQVDMRDGSICGAEALLRWRHPSRGLLGPASFLDVLLDSPQELALTEWVVDTACWHLSEWLTVGLPIPKVCFNLSARQLLAPNLAATLVRLCQSHGVPPALLEVEITENTLMGNVDQATAALRELRQAGISASLDDFGSGQASMAYLMQVPISTLKIDKSFVWALGAVSTATAVIRGIVWLAHSLGMRTLAEGVETEAQRQLLQDEGCDAMQGYLFSRPLPPAAFAAMIAAATAGDIPEGDERDGGDFSPP